MTNTSPFNDPKEDIGGDKIPLPDLVGALVLIDVKGETDSITTKFGESTAIQADLAVLDGPHKLEVFREGLIFQKMMKAQLRDSIGKKVLGRIYLGENKKGNPPYLLSPATDADKEVGTKYLAYVASRQPVATVPEYDEEPF